MCNTSCLVFGARVLKEAHVRHMRVLEVGARDVNGSLRPIVEAFAPSQYLGVDIAPGPGIDAICDVSNLVSRYGPNAWDLVVCTEMLEHVSDWRSAVSNLKNALRVNGHLLVTTRSIGFGYHEHPTDYWRFEVGDIEPIFGDLELIAAERDPEEPGIFVYGGMPESFIERDLSSYQVYAMEQP